MYLVGMFVGASLIMALMIPLVSRLFVESEPRDRAVKAWFTTSLIAAGLYFATTRSADALVYFAAGVIPAAFHYRSLKRRFYED